MGGPLMRARLLAALAVLLAAVAFTATPAQASPARAGLTATGADLCAQVGYNAGFRGNPLVTAVAVAMAESRCNPSAYAYNGASGDCPSGSTDRGLWQINNCYHPTVSDTCAYDPQCNANAAYSISGAGSSWTQWTTYRTGDYLTWWSTAQAAVNRLSGGGGPAVTGTILASPYLNVRAGPGTAYGSAGHANYGDTVTISCYTYGEYVSGGYWPSSTWDRITDPNTGATGYAADTWINTTNDVKTMVGPC
ncbi:transglycosylase SLT domain-containing protein [Dactylosporangium matsuzakiense]|nr:transglycosylase SLT domain-containing protein [Dactylosporangium matsuzakiense]UWZ47587.1 transglycosylase SLT domain-containing protein [Dactylosporangium matsuzakiense]